MYEVKQRFKYLHSHRFTQHDKIGAFCVIKGVQDFVFSQKVPFSEGHQGIENHFIMDEQALTAFEENLKALFRSAKRVSSSAVNLTERETVVLPKIAEDVDQLLRIVQELENRHCRGDERTFLESVFSGIKLIPRFPLYVIDFLKRAHQKSSSKASSIVACPEAISRTSFYTFLGIISLFLCTGSTLLNHFAPNQENISLMKQNFNISTNSTAYSVAAHSIAKSVAEFTLVLIFSICFSGLLIRFINFFPWSLYYCFFFVLYPITREK